jgi:hypothetical protein
MQPASSSFIKRSIVSGTVSGIAAMAAAALAGKKESHSYAAPINATSHIIWGDEAARHDEASFKYTATGFLLNHGAAIMWSAIYGSLAQPRISRWFARRPALAPLAPVLSAAAVSAGAYVTDYILIPKRFTPGWEKRVSGKSVAMIFGALALGMAASTLLDRKADS